MRIKYLVGLLVGTVCIVIAVVLFYPTPNTTNTDSDNTQTALKHSLRIERNMSVYMKESEAIAIGEFVGKDKPIWNSTNTDISTPVQFRVSEVLKGGIQPGTTIAVLQWGGEIEGVMQQYEGAIRYAKGEKNLLLLGKDEEYWGVFQGDWGQFPIDADGNVQDFDGKTVTLESFKGAIRAELQ